MNFSKAVFVIFLIFSFNRLTAQKPLGYLILNKEEKLGLASIDHSIKILDDLVVKCASEIRAKNRNPRETLKIIGEIIFEFGFTFADNHSTYSQALDSKKFDCDQFSITYLTICRNLKLPVYPVLIPQHMVISWEDQRLSFFWETTINVEKTSI